jgi:hypothetical protein
LGPLGSLLINTWNQFWWLWINQGQMCSVISCHMLSQMLYANIFIKADLEQESVLLLLGIVTETQDADFVQLFAHLNYTPKPTIRNWWSQWGIIAASHGYSCRRWWSDIVYSLNCIPQMLRLGSKCCWGSCAVADCSWRQSKIWCQKIQWLLSWGWPVDQVVLQGCSGRAPYGGSGGAALIMWTMWGPWSL